MLRPPGIKDAGYKMLPRFPQLVLRQINQLFSNKALSGFTVARSHSAIAGTDNTVGIQEKNGVFGSVYDGV